MTTSTTREFACCPGAAWAQAADFGHADGIEFTLGRCSACGRYWVHLWTPYSRDAGYVALDDAAAHELSTMAPGPDRKRRLAELFNP